MNKDSSFIEEVGEGVGHIIRFIATVKVIIMMGQLAHWMFKQGVESWRVKDEMYRRDCIVLPIAGVVFAIGCLGVGIFWFACPEFR